MPRYQAFLLLPLLATAMVAGCATARTPRECSTALTPINASPVPGTSTPSHSSGPP